MASVDALVDPRVAEGCRRLLDDGERLRNSRFKRVEDRHRDLLARAVVRTLLSAYVPVAPAHWRFERDDHGRPLVAEPMVPDLHFSLSHAGSLVTCVVAREPRVGVDVEKADTAGALPEALPARERRAIGSLPPTAFYAFWTLHEAYAKASGTTFGDGAGDAWFELSGDTGATLHEGTRVAEGWWFHRLAPAPGYVLAVALRVGPGDRPRLVRLGAPPLPGWGGAQ